MTPILGDIIGAVIGTVGGLFTGWIETKKYRAETERLEKQWGFEKAKWEHDKQMFAAQAEAQSEANADAAFVTSLASGREDNPFALPAGSWKWLLVPLVVVEAARRGMRPFLTLYLVVLTNSNPAMSPGAWMAVGWWFGSRAGKSMAK